MDAQKALKAVMKHKRITQHKLAETLGKPYNTVRNTLYGSNMKIETLTEMADALGCDVVLRDRKTGKLYR